MSLRRPSEICFFSTGGLAFDESVGNMPNLPAAKNINVSNNE